MGRSPAAALMLIVLGLGVCSAHAETVPLKRENGTFVVPVVVNSQLTLNFTIDSGASDVCIPKDVVSTLVRTGTINNGDVIDIQQYQLADGSMTTARRIRIRSLRVGSIEVRNVVASVVAPAGALLLGQSFLSRLPSWTIDNKAHALVINKSPDNVPIAAEPVSPEAVRAQVKRAKSDWLALGGYTDDEGQLFIDASSVRFFENGHGLAWLKVVYASHAKKDPVGNSDRWLTSVVSRDEIDCNGQVSRTDDMIFYYEDGTEWRPPTGTLPTHWHQQSNPMSAGVKVMKIVCRSGSGVAEHN